MTRVLLALALAFAACTRASEPQPRAADAPKASPMTPAGSTVALDVSGSQFELYTDGEWAYPASPEEDARIVAAMKSGAQAVLTARSGRGTQTKDTFSLLGFTATVDDAAKRCTD